MRAQWQRFSDGLWFVPSLIVIVMGALAFALVQLDNDFVGHETPWVFGGDANAARTVLSTIAGSLITVAGLTFSVTMVVLQLASSQFSPRVLPNFLGDRITQTTVGAFVGIFVFCLIGLRAVGGRDDFVPRLTVTLASGLGVGAVILLIVFIHHVSTMIQVSHIARRIGERTVSTLDSLHPEPFGAETDEDSDALLEEWREREEPAVVRPSRPGYVQRVDVDSIAAAVCDDARQVLVAVTPGDFVSAGTALVEIWPAGAAEGKEGRLRQAITITGERSFDQDASFGVRQLGDIALRAISPGINDPTTAVTCIGYIRSVIELLSGRRLPAQVRRYRDGDLVVIARRVDYQEYLDTLIEIGRYAQGDARIVRQLLRSCAGIAAAARRAGADERATAAEEVAETIAEQALDEARSDRDRQLIGDLLQRVRAPGARERG